MLLSSTRNACVMPGICVSSALQGAECMMVQGSQILQGVTGRFYCL